MNLKMEQAEEVANTNATKGKTKKNQTKIQKQKKETPEQIESQFNEEKNRVVQSIIFTPGEERDRSRAGKVDTLIIPFVQTVNLCPMLYTT
jgi:actin-related protein